MDLSRTWVQILASISGSLVFLISGSLLGWTSPVQIKFQQDADLTLNDTQVSWLAIYLFLGMLCAPIPMILIADFIGRKKALLATAIPFLISWILIMVAKNKPLLYAGRFIGGLGIGSSFAIGPMYVMEITELSVRAPLSSIFQVMLSLGVLYVYAIGPYTSSQTLGIASALLLVLLIFNVIWVPETPYFYIMTNRLEDAEKSLSRLRRGTDDNKLSTGLNIVQHVVEYNARLGVRPRDLIYRRVNRKPLLYVLGLIFNQQFAGIAPILCFMARICQLSRNIDDKYMVTIIISVLFVIFSIVATVAVCYVERRPMLIASTIGCTISLIVLGLSFLFAKQKALNWLPIFSMAIYIISFAVGLGPLPWVIAIEVFNAAIIYIAIGMATMFLAFLAILTVFIFDEFSSGDGISTPFFMFAILTAFGFLWIYLYLPETKDKPQLTIFVEFGGLEDIRESP